MYQISPVDNFFFRSAIPFEAAGETSLVESIFPPLPLTYAGAVKGCATSKRIRIGFNGVTIKNEFHFPIPLDLAPFEKENKKFFNNMIIEESPLSSFPLSYYLCNERESGDKMKTKDDLYMNSLYMQKYLNGEICNFESLSLEEHFIYEPKIGIAIDKANSIVKEKHLYYIRMLRPKNELKLVADIKNINIEGEALIRLGGESKVARIQPFDHELNISSSVNDSSFFKLYFATPAIFKNGWLPAWIDPTSKTGKFSYKNKSVKVQLITAAIGRKVAVGGFGYDNKSSDDIEKYRPREMRYAVPSGSVYYFKILEGDFKTVMSLFNQKCISDYRENYGFEYPPLQYDRIKYCDRGFGYAFVGALNKEQERMFKNV